jgi:hypothetical protein
MKIQVRARLFLQRVAIAALVLGGIYFSIKNLQDVMAMTSRDGDHITPWEIRFQPIKKLLPFKRGVVGYLTNSDVLGTGITGNEEGEYTLTQYTMSPIIISRGMNREWVIADLNTKAFQIWSASNYGQFRVYSLGDDLFLFHRLSQ